MNKYVLYLIKDFDVSILSSIGSKNNSKSMAKTMVWRIVSAVFDWGSNVVTIGNKKQSRDEQLLIYIE